jgi:hypothetical protein
MTNGLKGCIRKHLLSTNEDINGGVFAKEKAEQGAWGTECCNVKR